MDRIVQKRVRQIETRSQHIRFMDFISLIYDWASSFFRKRKESSRWIVQKRVRRIETRPLHIRFTIVPIRFSAIVINGRDG
jgi:hypothetical protein